MEKSKPKGEISRNLEASENRGYNSSASAPGTKYIWYYLLLKASRGGSIWFQWGLAFIPSSSWTGLCSPRSITHLPRWHNKLVALSRLDHKSLLVPWMPRISSMTNKESSTSFCFDFQVDPSALGFTGICIFRVLKNHPFSFCYISTMGGSDINLFWCECQTLSQSSIKFIHLGWMGGSRGVNCGLAAFCSPRAER